MAENTGLTNENFTTNLSEWSNKITTLIERDYNVCGIEFDDYSRKCALEAMTAIYTLVKNNPKVNMKNLDISNLRGIVEQCASLKLNANAYPRECYFQLRNVKTGDTWTQVVEMGIEGDGNDAILRNFGENVDMIYPVWIVKMGDVFAYPKHKGIEISPPEWEQTGQSEKVDKVVYPVKLKDGSMQYLIAERESVKTNLFAHVRNNLMNETFEICKDRYKATDEQKKKIAAEKEKIYEALRACETVDDMMKCEIARPYISAAWLDTPESMIVRKMRNNAIKKFKKNYNAMAQHSFLAIDETYQQVQEEIAENANSVEFIEAVEEEPPKIESAGDKEQLPLFMQEG